MKTTVHVIPHSHWDREWYMPLEHHRGKLVELMDRVLELLQGDDYPNYHLDGQTIPLNDYLEIRPQKRALVEKMVEEGRLKAGPWYVLQDTYLTGSEANVHNMLTGMRISKEFGGSCLIGYLPDAFGNAGQFPQLLKQAGMKAAVFGRGVTMLGADGQSDPENHRLCHSEFNWESPDGSSIPAVYFANWYSNGMEIPVDEAKARIFWDRTLAAARKYASTGHLLMMNGCDHQPVQTDLPEALNTARRLYPDIEFRQSTMEEYVDAMLGSMEAPAETVCGELDNQQTHGLGTLRNTASSRWRIKALNRRNEVLLEKQAEPMAVMAAMAGDAADTDMLEHAWMVLMQNHPHDSICGCSLDEVHREMESRYHRSIQQGEWLLAKSQAQLAGRIGAQLPPEGETGAAIVVWNSGAWSRSGVVKAVVGVERVYGTQKAYAALAGRPLPDYVLTNSRGEELPCSIEDLGVNFGYDLPDDRFRQPYCERQVRVTFLAENVPAFGYDTLLLREGTPAAHNAGLTAGQRFMDNGVLRAEIADDGSLTLLDRRTGRSYAGMGVLEDSGDVGNEYNYRAALGGAITTAGTTAADIRLIEHTPVRASIRAEHIMRIPARADSALDESIRSMADWDEREIARSGEMVELKAAVTYTLDAGGKQVDVRVELDNNAMDHRLRLLIPTGIQGDQHYADSVFDVVKRPDVPGKWWINPSRCNRMQLFVAAAEEKAGLAVSNRGLYEYEMLSERRTIAVTLLRAVAELGDWGVFLTPEAQCIGPFCAELALIPLQGESEIAESYRMAHNFQTDLAASALLSGSGELPARKSFLCWSGDGLIATAFKPAADGQGAVLRLFNATERETELTVTTELPVCMSNILENRGEALTAVDGAVRLPVGPKEIVSLRIG